ncbi:MAG TPA: ABC transporter substrate-binding protein [Terriglobia bacterium]|nr:ABC transporter substrate-binding protein [Terriglobia bacterium]
MPNDQLRIMVYRHSVFYSPLIAAIAGGFLRDEGLVATYFQKPPQRNVFDMFRGGEVDIMQAAVSTSWDPLSKGIRDIPVHFAQINQRDGFFLTGRAGGATFEWKDLEGARLLADHAQQPFAMLKYGLHLKGIHLDRIELINAGAPDAMEGAFREGRGDFVHLQGPAPQQLEIDRAGKIVAAMGEIIPPVAFSSLMATREFLSTAKAQAFMRAYRRSLQFVIESPAQGVAKAEASFFPHVPAGAIESAVARYQQLGTWRLDPTITREQYETAMDVFIYAGVFKERFAYEDVVASLT